MVKKIMQYNLAKSTVIAVMKKTDQEIIVSRKHKSGLEIEVLRLYVPGLEIRVKLAEWLYDNKKRCGNRGGFKGGLQ